MTGVLLLASCGGGTVTPVTPTVGSVTIPSGNGYTVVITDSSGNVVPSSSYNNLTPGTYTVTFSQTGYVSQSQTFTVSAGQSVVLTAPTLVAVTPVTVSGAYYLDANGKQVAITQDDLNNAGTRFVFYAWLQNQAGGIDPTKLAGPTDPGTPAANELAEVAPLNTQNVAAGYVAYKSTDGVIHPLVGANVRWDILAQTGNVRFSAADDGGAPSGAVGRQDINDNALSANTYTNSATGSNVRFPSSAEYPLYNITGVNTPDTNGFTWTALNHDPAVTAATARVRAVAYVNGTEITKRFLDKTFAPSAKLAITKTVNPTGVGLNQAGNYTITVTNSGAGPATGIQLNDVLKSGDGSVYNITAPAGGTANATDGFDATFDLAPGASRTFTFTGQASAVGVYCDVATVVTYNNGSFGAVTPTNLNAQACLTVTAPTLNIVKSLGTVDATGAFTPIASGAVVNPNTPVFARITVSNQGTAPATNVVVTDQLDPSTTAAASYAIKSAPVSSPAGITSTVNPANSGFVTGAFNLAPGATTSFTFSAAGAVDGTYCDTGTFTATSNNGSAVTPATSNIACFKVASPRLAITKTNSQIAGQPPLNTLTPGSSYASTITVTNSGSATATAVAVSDLLGQIAGGNTFMNFGSGSYTVTGTAQAGSVSFANNRVSTTPATIDLAPGAVLTLNLTSTVPQGAPAGQYCDIGSYSSTNAGTGQAQACVTVVTFLSEQTQLTDTLDPIRQGDTTGTIVASFGSVEPASNEAAINNVFIYNFGATDPIQQTPGVFNFSNTQVYYDPTPVRDPNTGAITSDYTHSSSTLLTVGTQYTVNANSGVGQQTITLNPTFAITPGGVIIVRTQVTAPAGTPARQYQETMRWNNTGQGDNQAYTNFKAESTTVTP
ncbi:hypothetical protein MF271_20865 (plasmid) [Deinococcus sp. KNUC1210]|uniref:beta strand repeat-containing protein n=1 Tax=Deinococcus sp. KNUC1210 TaxID=2917691 RepID=UPI001EEFB88B|nr:phage tail tube protein [Deinococcus sp. KNUC1210]ULH17510.1 hypothetical protein MF271_20865 [Deinococcus sp. KNUC1210]